MAVVVLVAAGCGDGDGSDEVITAAPAAEEVLSTPEPSPRTSTTTDVADNTADQSDLYDAPVLDEEAYIAAIADTPALPADGGELIDCADVPPLEATVQGTLGGTANPDEAVMVKLFEYGMVRPDTFGGLWIDRAQGGTVVLAFTDDLQPHRDAVRELVGDSDLAVDLLQVRFTELQLRATQDAVFQEFAGEYGLASAGGGTRNRIELGFVDPPEGALETLAALLPTAAVCVTVTFTPEAPTGPLDVIPDLEAEDPLVSCFGIAPVPYSTLVNPRAVDQVDHPAVEALRRELDAPSFEPLPDGDWVVLSIDDELASFAVFQADGFGVATFADLGSGWVLQGWGAGGGGCDAAVALPDGLGLVEARLNPDALPQPGDTTINLLVTERGCASGRDMGDALVGPQVVETDQAVLVAFAVIPVSGPANCQGNPSTSVTIELNAPLGDRQLLDGLTVPPQPLTDEMY